MYTFIFIIFIVGYILIKFFPEQLFSIFESYSKKRKVAKYRRIFKKNSFVKEVLESITTDSIDEYCIENTSISITLTEIKARGLLNCTFRYDDKGFKSLSEEGCYAFAKLIIDKLRELYPNKNWNITEDEDRLDGGWGMGKGGNGVVYHCSTPYIKGYTISIWREPKVLKDW